MQKLPIKQNDKIIISRYKEKTQMAILIISRNHYIYGLLQISISISIKFTYFKASFNYDFLYF